MGKLKWHLKNPPSLKAWKKREENKLIKNVFLIVVNDWINQWDTYYNVSGGPMIRTSQV